MRTTIEVVDSFVPLPPQPEATKRAVAPEDLPTVPVDPKVVADVVKASKSPAK